MTLKNGIIVEREFYKGMKKGSIKDKKNEKGTYSYDGACLLKLSYKKNPTNLHILLHGWNFHLKIGKGKIKFVCGLKIKGLFFENFLVKDINKYDHLYHYDEIYHPSKKIFVFIDDFEQK